MGLEITSINLGEVSFKGALPKTTSEFEIKSILNKYGFALLNDKKQQTISTIKSIVDKGIQLQLESKESFRFSEFISKELHKDYNFLGALFSEQEGITIGKYIIIQRISMVQNLLTSTDKSLTEISDELGYSSVSHLSRQLKTYTGFDVYYYKNLRKNNLLSV